MRLLLDTHVWVWSLLEPERIGPKVAVALADPANELWLSPISTWEVLMLIARGRIQVDRPAVDWVGEALSRTSMREATLSHAVALRSRTVGLSHADPADRFIAATASVYELTLVTADRRLLDAGAYDALSAL